MKKEVRKLLEDIRDVACKLDDIADVIYEGGEWAVPLSEKDYRAMAYKLHTAVRKLEEVLEK